MKTSRASLAETDESIIEKHNPACRKRARTELAIVHRLIKDLSAAGYLLCVNDGEEIIRGDEQELVAAIFAVDEAWLKTSRPGSAKKSSVYLIMGNDGHDIISDYGISLEPVMEPLNKWIDEQMDAGKF